MSNYKFETLQLHVGQEQADPATDSRAVPIYQTTSYVFRNSQHAADRFGLADAGNIYGRLTNSTQDVFEKRIAALEGGVAALATASGAAAITYTIEALAQAGDHIVAQKTIYGGSYNLLEHTLTQFGVTTTFVDAHDLEEVENAIQPNTKAVYLETLGNPNSDIPDIDAIAAIAHKHGLPLVIDNTFGTPYLIRPIEHGADIVVHSATKFIGGHGTTLGGIIVDSGKFDWKASGKYGNIAAPNPSYHGVSFADAAGPAAFVTYIRAILLRDTGATISPFNAFLLLQGTETLSLRIERHVENTKKVVEFLANHPQVEKVNHPSLPDHPDHALYEKYFPNGGASIFTFNIKGGREEAFKFIDNLKIFSLLPNVADVKSLVIHPASTTHSQLTDAELAEQRRAAEAYNALLRGEMSVSTGGASAPPMLYAGQLTVGGAMCTIDIPKIGVYLPVRHGTGAETLERAVGHVVGTSLPVGGAGTHAVLSAHSGMASAKLFTDIDQLVKGDVFYIHVLGEVLAYEVDQIATVLPSDTSLLQIEEDKDYVTLVTCMPFGVNTHRLLVRGHRVPYVPELVVENGKTPKAASSWTQHYLTGLGIGLGVLAAAGRVCFFARRRRRG